MKKVLLLAVLLVFISTTAIADGLVHVQSQHDVNATADRLENVLKAKGMTVFNRINHAQAAGKVGVDLRPTELIIFGNPKVGSPLMSCQQTVAIDLPQKALIWQDEGNKVWITYNDPAYLVKRHNINGCEKVVAKVTNALAGLTGKAAGN